MGCIVTVCMLVGCSVPIASSKALKWWEPTLIHTFSLYDFAPTVMQTSGIGQTSVDSWVVTCGLYCHSLDNGMIIVQVNCLQLPS